MKTSAVICELNPLHYGHTYIFEKARDNADCVIAIMSGNFVQRAEPAIIDKYARAEMALRAGADLVLELPFPWCAASAEYFAKAGTHIAAALAADSLAFGVNAADTDVLWRFAEFFNAPETQSEILQLTNESDLSTGIAAIREKCLKSKFGDVSSEILHSPNDILAVEYLRQILKNAYSLKPCMHKRVSTEDNPNFLGATGIRTLLHTHELPRMKQHVPDYVYEKLSDVLSTGNCAFPEKFSEIAFNSLRINQAPQKENVAEGNGGLLARICTSANEAVSTDEMLERAKTKKYTNARIRRVLLYYLLRITPDMLNDTPRVVTVLAANETGCAYLSAQRKSDSITLLTKPANYRSLDEYARLQYEHTQRADRLYTLCRQTIVPADYYMKKSPYIKK